MWDVSCSSQETRANAAKAAAISSFIFRLRFPGRLTAADHPGRWSAWLGKRTRSRSWRALICGGAQGLTWAERAAHIEGAKESLGQDSNLQGDGWRRPVLLSRILSRFLRAPRHGKVTPPPPGSGVWLKAQLARVRARRRPHAPRPYPNRAGIAARSTPARHGA